MCTAGGEVVSVRCCSGGLNYYPHRLHLTLSVSSVIHIPCSFVPLPLLSDFNTRSCDFHMTTSHPSPAHLPCSTASCSALHLTLPVSFVIHIQSFVHHPPPLHTQTAHETEMKGGGAVQFVCANVGAVGWWRMDSSCHYHNGRVDVTSMT